MSKFNHFCLLCVLAICLMVSIFAGILQLQNQSIIAEIAQRKNELKQLKSANYDSSEHLNELQNATQLCQNVQASNEVLKQSIKNLFDLVPDSIVLNEVLMEQKSLLIKGSTPTKEIFNTMLKTPLVSIFSSSKTSFFQQKSGWYNFTSINTIENSEGFNE